FYFRPPTSTRSVTAFSNRRTAKTAVYTPQNSDNGYTIGLSSGFYDLTFLVASAYDDNFNVMVVNEDTTRGKRINVTNVTSFVLYPLKAAAIFRQNSLFYYLKEPRYLLPASLSMYVGPDGNNANDGLLTTPLVASSRSKM